LWHLSFQNASDKFTLLSVTYNCGGDVLNLRMNCAARGGCGFR
jgi:hypothetical protein